MAIPVKPEPVKTFGMISSVSETEGSFGPQVVVNIRPADPNATSERSFFFSLKTHPNSAWMKFVSSFNHALQKAVQGASEIASAEQMVNTWVKLEENQRSVIINGEYRDVNDRTIVEVFTSQDVAAAAWKSHVEALTVGIRKEAPPPPPESTTPEPLPASIVIEFKKQYEKVGKNVDALLAIASAWGYGEDKGYSKEFILAALK